MFKVQYRVEGVSLWNSALPTSLQGAMGYARTVEVRQQPAAVRVVPSVGAAPSGQLLDLRV